MLVDHNYHIGEILKRPISRSQYHQERIDSNFYLVKHGEEAGLERKLRADLS